MNDDDLAEWMAGEEPDWDSDPTPDAMADQRKANALMRRLGPLREKYRWTDEPFAKEEHARVDAWLALQRGRITWLETWLANWHQAQFMDHGTATIELPAGNLASRKETTYEYEDEDAFLTWAEQHAAGLVRPPAPRPPTARAPDKNAVKKMFPAPKDLAMGQWDPVTEDGEKVPGLVVRVGRSFDAKPNDTL